MMKRCNKCSKIKEETEFYFVQAKNGRRHTTCKKCVNQRRTINLKKKPVYIKKPRQSAFSKLPKEDQDYIRFEMSIGRPMTHILKEVSVPIKYITFRSWVKKGDVPEWNAEDEMPQKSKAITCLSDDDSDSESEE